MGFARNHLLLHQMLSDWKGGRTSLFGLLVLLCPRISAADPFVQSIKHREGLLVCGHVAFVRTDHTPSGLFATQEDLIYASDGRFKHVMIEPKRFGSDISKMTFVSGRGWRYIETNDSTGTVVVFGDKNWPYDGDFRFFMVGRPCFPMGAGFVDGLSEARFSNHQIVATLKDRTKLSVTYRNESKAIPESLERSWANRVVNRWEYSGFLSAGANLWVPAKSDYFDLALKGNNRTYEIHHAAFGTEPKDSELETNWLRPGVRVEDDRVVPAVYWSYEELKTAFRGIDHPTPELLLRLSQQKGHYFSQVEGSKKARVSGENRRGSASLQVMMWVFLTVLTGGGLILKGFELFKTKG
jgi:hypothetical protein